jgi:hypothetical protein
MACDKKIARSIREAIMACKMGIIS